MDYSEAEQLADLCQKVVYSELMNDVIKNVPEGPARKFVVKSVTKVVDQQINTMCNAGWNAAVSATKGAKEQIETSATELLTPLIEQENKIKEQIIEKTNEKTTPFVEAMSAKTFQPVIDTISGPILEAFVASIQGLHSCISTGIKDGNYNTVENLDLYMEIMLNVLDCAFMDDRDENPLTGAWKVMKPFQSKVLKAIDSVISAATGSISADDIYTMVTDCMIDVSKRGVYAFHVAMKGKGDYVYSADDATNHLTKDVLTRYVHDVKLSFKALLVGILSGITSPSYESLIITPSMELVAPIQETVDAIPVPGVSALIDLEGLSTEVLETVLDDAINTVVDTVFEKNNTKLDETVAAL